MRIARTLLSAALSVALFPALAADTPVAKPGDAELDEARAELRDARAELRELTRRIAELSVKVGRSESDQAMAFRYLAEPNRAMIGVVLGAEGDDVVLAAVTPGGPAEKAGLRAGDVVTGINDATVPKVALDPTRPVSGALLGGAAVERTRELIGKLEDGQKVKLEVQRDGKPLKFEVAAERRESWSWPMLAGSMAFEWDSAMPALAPLVAIRPMEDIRIEIPEIEVIVEDARREAERARGHAEHDAAAQARHEADRAIRRVMVYRGGELFDLRLAQVEPELGRYFGTDSGVLVLDKGDKTLPELKRGDVILSIGGERVETAAQAMRALARHDTGTAVNVEVMRDRKRAVVVVAVPERDDVLIPLPPRPPRVPAAPAAPRPPKTAPVPPPAPAAAPQPPQPPQPPVPTLAIA